jgi:hypothetical protein
MKAQEKKQKQVLARLKVWLLQGKTITHNEAQKKWRTNRLSEYVRRLRHNYHQMKISMTWITDKNGDRYGQYKLEVKVKKKVNFLKT